MPAQVKQFYSGSWIFNGALPVRRRPISRGAVELRQRYLVSAHRRRLPHQRQDVHPRGLRPLHHAVDSCQFEHANGGGGANLLEVACSRVVQLLHGGVPLRARRAGDESEGSLPIRVPARPDVPEDSGPVHVAGRQHHLHDRRPDRGSTATVSTFPCSANCPPE